MPARSRNQEPVALPRAFSLAQNEPNPFSRTTTIRFDLPTAAHVRLEVFDLLGRRVARLADGPFEAGSHAIRWDHPESGSRVAPGVYLCRITAGQQRAERKMMLLP